LEATNYTAGYIFIVLLLVEQYMYWIFASYPYRFGIPIKSVEIPTQDCDAWQKINGKRAIFSTKIIENRNEIYFHLKYPSLTLGPLLFVGHIRFDKKIIMKVRIGYLAALFVIGISLSALQNFTVYSLTNLLLLFIIVLYAYFSLLKKFRKMLQ